MKSVIQFLVILATLAGMVIWALLAQSLDEYNTSRSIMLGVLAVLIVVALILLFRWDKKRIHDEELELRQRVEVKITEALKYKQPIEFYVKRSQIVFLAFVLLFCLGGIYFGVQLLSFSPTTKWYGGSIFLLAGVLFCIAIVVSGKRLIGRPVIHLDIHGINHFLFGLIPWTDITSIDLLFFKSRSSEISVLKVTTTDNQRYLARLSRWYRFFQGGKTAIELQLQLPLSEADARFVEGVAKGYAEYAGAPTVENKMSKKITEELSRLQTPQQRMDRLQAMMAENSQEFVKRHQTISRAYRVTNIFLVIGVLAICVGVWVTSR